jgi:hypothetical protein
MFAQSHGQADWWSSASHLIHLTSHQPTFHHSVKQNPPSKRFQNVKGIERYITTELYAFDYRFVGILERYKMFVAGVHNL